MFHELSSALELLTDEKARSTYDKFQQAKKAAQLRNDQLDIKRRKLKADLEARERGVNVKVETTTTSFANAEEQLKTEIDRLRKEGSRLLEEEQRLMREQIHKNSSAARGSGIPVQQPPSRIKIKWKADEIDPTNGGYNAKSLRKFLGKYGDISELVILPSKRGSALIEFKTKEAGEMAVAYEKGDLQNPLKLSWLGDKKDRNHKSTTNQRCSDQQSATQTSSISSTDFESLVLRNLRQAEERKRLIEQMEREDN